MSTDPATEPDAELRDDAVADVLGDDLRGAGRAEESTLGYFRSPRDVLRLVVFAFVALVLLAITKWVEDSILGFEEDLLELASFLTPSIERVLFGALAVISGVVGLLVFAAPFATRRYRLFGYVFVSNTVVWALVALVEWWLARGDQTIVTNRIALRAGLSPSDTAASLSVAQLAASFVVLGPFVGRRWRRAGLVTLCVITVLHVVVAVHLPANVFVALPLGAAVGAAALFAFGRPDRRPTDRAIVAAMGDAGLPIADLRKAKVDARGSTPYFATLVEGTPVFVKVLGAEERAADLLFRVYRFLRLRNVGDDRPFSSLRRAVEHEALVALQARDVGVRTPRMRGVVDVGTDSMLLAYELINGRSLDSLPDDEVTDELLRGIWQLIGDLRTNRIAHRDLRRANIFVGADGEPWLIDFGFSELAASDGLLDADVAQLLASFAVVVGAERAVATAVDELGTEAVGRALGRLQLPALSGATQSALREQHGLLEQLQSEVVERCGVEHVEFEKLARVDRKAVLTVAVLAIATYVIVPQFSDLGEIVNQVRDANWAWAPLVLLMSAATYVAATASLAGAIPDRLPAGPLLATQVGSSFASKLAPAGLGGMALNVRFLQKQGVDHPVAVSGVGLNTVAGLVGHASLIGIFVVWAGRDAFGAFELPSPRWLLVGLAAVAVLAAVSMAVPSTRRLVAGKLWPLLRRSIDGVSAVLRRPGKVALLLGGSVAVTCSYLVGLYFCVEAFGGGLPLATVGAVYLTGAAIATAAPTPGGLGAVEAALIAGLSAAGLDHAVAIPSVFLFRLATFWLPILPGWGAFLWLQRREYV